MQWSLLGVALAPGMVDSEVFWVTAGQASLLGALSLLHSLFYLHAFTLLIAAVMCPC